MANPLRWTLLGLLSLPFFIDVWLSSAEVPRQRFEYKYSFKPPYLAQKDGSVPFWEHTGHAIASTDNVRITPSLRSQKGAIWTKSKTSFPWWEVEVTFRVTGRGRIGADGLAFWYTEEKGKEGPVFGSSDKWNGLGIFFDSFDNDNKHNNPYVMAILNDGTKMYDHQNDGTTQQLAGCLRDFRNKPFPILVKIEYYKNTLTVLINNGMTNNVQDYEICLRAENIFLPQYGYFGLSAATGGLADDHDALKFNTFSLHPPDSPYSTTGRITEEEKQKLSQEYQEYQQKLEKQKEEYRREHPDAKPTTDDVPDDWFETDNQRELRQIFTGQSHMFNLIRELNQKLDEVVGRQERTLSLIGSINTSGGVQALPPAQYGQQPPPPVQQGSGSMQRHEIDTLLSTQREVAMAARDIKAYVNEIHQKSNTILQNQAKQPTATVQNVGYDVHAIVNEVKEGLNLVKRDISSAAQRINAQSGCPSNDGCLSSSVYIILTILQTLAIILFYIFKSNRDTQAKKFY